MILLYFVLGFVYHMAQLFGLRGSWKNIGGLFLEWATDVWSVGWTSTISRMSWEWAAVLDKATHTEKLLCTENKAEKESMILSKNNASFDNGLCVILQLSFIHLNWNELQFQTKSMDKVGPVFREKNAFYLYLDNQFNSILQVNSMPIDCVIV